MPSTKCNVIVNRKHSINLLAASGLICDGRSQSDMELKPGYTQGVPRRWIEALRANSPHLKVNFVSISNTFVIE